MEPNNAQVAVRKLNPQGQETYRYYGTLIEHRPDSLVLEAHFTREDMDVHGMLLAHGDRFMETYYFDRWYNIFEIHARDNDRLRGWYCNVTSPAVFSGEAVTYVDLALDLLIFPDGRQIVLDEDEFAQLDIANDTRQRALSSLAELQEIFREKLR